MLAFKYISFHYIKYFLIILIALMLFLVGFDYMENAGDLSSSANLVLIYLVYKAFFAIDMLLPLSLVFAMVSTKIFLIRSNALVSFYSLGYSRVDVLRPFVVVSTSIIVIFISLHALPSFSRADEYSNNIRKNAEYLSPTRDLFFTYKDQYVYFSKMLPLQERAEGIRVFSVINNSLQEVLVAKSAVYRDDYWHIKQADIIRKPIDLSFESSGIRVTSVEDMKILEGFRPKILDQVYEGKVNFTITDAIDAIFLLKNQNISVSTIKGALYKIFVYPFFVPCLVIIIFFFVPISPRFLNVSLFSFGAILATLLVWGILFMLIELSNNKTIPSEIGVVAPIVILFLISMRQYRHYRLAT
uniref:Predicted permease YjgP/YjgQ family n=1 Tax=uncultured Campylobacterota bacterium TaxID=120858 RepID=Q2YZL1_9BACT|nr:predicted permease YjgP/YjgQ family [uncultured Campylobacterota bacterium]